MRNAKRLYLDGRLSDAALSDRLTKGLDARRAAADAARWRRHCEMKFDPSQPRDDHGRWTSSGGGGRSSPQPAPKASQLGRLSMVHETGYGPGHEAAAARKVSTGKSDKGGVSYGAYQLASNEGQVQRFLQTTGAKWASEFEGMDPTDPNGDFAKTWKSIAERDPAEFFNAQERYIQQTHYNPVVRRVERATGLDINSRPLAVQQVVWSMAVQHGGAAKVITNGVNDLGQ